MPFFTFGYCTAYSRSIITECAYILFYVFFLFFSVFFFADTGRAWFLPVRLVGGDNYMEGRVEVYDKNEGRWGTVCDVKWDLDDAIVVCRPFGYSGPSSAFTGSQFGSGVGDIILDKVECIGTERNIGRCSHREIGQHNCEHYQDAGVVCTMGDEPTPGRSMLDLRKCNPNFETIILLKFTILGTKSFCLFQK